MYIYSINAHETLYYMYTYMYMYMMYTHIHNLHVHLCQYLTLLSLHIITVLPLTVVLKYTVLVLHSITP